MRVLLFLLKKEFKQIFRNKMILGSIFMMPTVQLMVLPLAADYEIKNINILIIDRDNTSSSRDIRHDILSSGYFRLVDTKSTLNETLEYLENDKTDIILEIPENFERNYIRDEKQKLFIAVNAVNGVKANIGAGYLANILRAYQKEFTMKQLGEIEPVNQINLTASNWFNRHLKYQDFMVPGILAILVTMIGAALSSSNIVREREVGTIEQINVTPVKKSYFIIGKLIPFWVLGIIVTTVGLIISRVVYGISPQGSLVLFYFFVSVYLCAAIGFGLLISTYVETQQQSMLVSFFFTNIFILMGGLYTSIDSMPKWAKVITYFNPISYFIEVSRGIVLWGSGFWDVLPNFLAITAFAFLFNIWAILNYKKTS